MPISLLLAIAIVRIVVSSDGFRRDVALQVAAAIANRTQGAVQLSGVTFGWNLAPCFQNLVIYRNRGAYRLEIESKQACVEQWFSAVGSGFRAVRVRLDAPAIQLQRENDGGEDTPFVDVRPNSAPNATPATRPGLRELTVVFDDLQLEWARLPVPERLANGAVGPIDGRITIQRRGTLSAATIAIRDRESEARLDGRVTPTSTGWDLSAGVEGDLVRLFGSLIDDLNLDIRRMPCEGTLGARFSDRTLELDLDLEEYDVDLSAELVSRGRLIGLDGRQQFRLTADFDRGTVQLGSGLVEINGVPVDVALRMRNIDKDPAFTAQFTLRTIPMGRLLRSVPGTSVPEVLGNIDPAVRLALFFEVAGRLSDATTWKPRLEHRLVGVDANTRTGLEFLKAPFAYRPLTGEGRTEKSVTRGPGTPGWLRYSDVPYVQRRAIIIAEDSTFPFHKGLELTEVKAAIEAAVRRGKRIRGGSTLTQQLVKNLFLTRDRTALRKAVELLLTFHVESVLSKPEIFELYTNVIEWGPNVYGLEAAARHYFGRSPGDLQPLEMVYLATLIPNPVRYHEHFEKKSVPPKHLRKVNFLLGRLHRLGQLSDEAFEAAKTSRLQFAR